MNDVFNSRFSITRFLKRVMSETYPTVPLFLNTVLRASEEKYLQTLDRYAVIDIVEGEIRYDQPVDVSFALYVKAESDPTTIWLCHAPYRISQACLQRRTSADETMIALYDYDSVVGSTAIASFLQDGTLPANFETILASTTTEVSYNGRSIGLKALPSPTAPVFEFRTEPYRAIWHLSFAFFHPGHVIGSNW